ncbi:MAG: polyprenyl synthetase family protein [Victivallales bacterium]|jgi:octaprenyl-diphosphate synthase|nr:polyprenyl synthetase family protein [Victivallales bacterium]
MLQIISQPIQQELKAFDIRYTEALRTHGAGFQFMLDFLAAKKGKRIRPLVLILSAKLCGKVSAESLDYAVILELLHTATLIHDEVVDNTRERRGQPSVMAQFDNRAAVLLGDYILSQAIVRGVAAENPAILKIFASLAQNLAEGELSQLLASSEPGIDEARYFEVIRKKTASLLAACSEMGAISAQADAGQVERLRTIGENLGLCFQLRDDIFDYYEEGDLGKPTGNDIREGKMTLPLIHALQTAPAEQTAPMLQLVREQAFSPENIARLIAFAKAHGGIEYATAKMQEIKAATLELLAAFPDSDAKTAFGKLMDYIIEREK